MLSYLHEGDVTSMRHFVNPWRRVTVGLCATVLGVCVPTARAGQNQAPPEASALKLASTASAPPDVSAPPADAQTTPSGVATKVLKAGQGDDHPDDNDCVTMVSRAWRRDGTLFSRSSLGDETVVQCLRPAMPGIAEALKLMVAGETRRIWLPADLTAPPVAHHGEKHMMEAKEPLVDLTLDVQLVQILHAPPTPSDLKQPPKGSIKLPSGVYMQVLKPGTGSLHPVMSSWITLDYTGWTSDGRLFESTVLAGHSRVIRLGMAIPGWQAALPSMVAGEKVRLWIPAALAYRDHPDNRFLPAGDLVFDLEILAFGDLP